MFSKSIKDKFIDHFKTPLRPRQLNKHAETVIETTRYKYVSNFISDLKNDGIIKSYKLTAKNRKTVTVCTSRLLDEMNPYEIAIAMFPAGYFCNLSSIYYHALTNQIPKSIYICNETISARQKSRTNDLSNSKLRDAFITPHRYTSYVFQLKNFEIIVIDKEKGSRSGVIKVRADNALCPNNSCITCIERALIDAVVTPQYNGGIVCVYTYFKNARHKLNIQKLADIYRQLNFVYPYSQSIGFFLERLGMKKQASVIYDAFPPKYTFYVDHNAKTSWEYDDKWNLYYPNGLVDEN